MADFTKLIQLLEKNGIKFKDSKNLIEAFTHSSFGSNNYERFEFLGDSVLKIVISNYLFKKYKKENEGKLTKLRAEIVSDKTLTLFSKKLGLDEYVILGKGEKRTGRAMDTFLACVFEALLGVIFIEYGNSDSLDLIHNFIIKNFKKEIETIENNIEYLNPKALLQEYSQHNFKELPIYNTIGEKGAAHNRMFEVCVTIKNKTYKSATGNSKKEAQKLAAQNALSELGIEYKEEI